MNEINLIGNLVKDPELRKNKELDICEFTIAVNRNLKNDDRTDYFPITVFGNLANVVSTYCKKGNKVAISGSCHMDSYISKTTGVKQTYVEIIARNVEFLTNKSDSAKQQQSTKYGTIGTNDTPFD